MDKRLMLIIIGGPSGSGKTTVCNYISSNFPDIIYYKNQYTTREPRIGEEGKGAYQSVSRAEFEKLEKAGQILMKTEFADNYYWYTADFINDIRKYFNKSQCLVVDSIQPINNWQKFKKDFPEITVKSIFLFSLNLDVLKSRISKRANLSEGNLKARLAHAQAVLAEAELYDYKIDTTDLNHIEKEIFSIIKNFQK